MSVWLSLAGQLRLVGATLVLLGLGHVILPRVLGWPDQFSRLDPLTRRILYVHTLFIAVACVLLGLAPLVLTARLLVPGTTRTVVLCAECVFWALRWCVQFVAFPARLWRGSRLYVTGYLGFAALWTWIIVVFAVAWLRP